MRKQTVALALSPDDITQTKKLAKADNITWSEWVRRAIARAICLKKTK